MSKQPDETRLEMLWNAIGYIVATFGAFVAFTMRDPTGPLLVLLAGLGILIVVRLQQIVRLLNR